MGNEMNYTRDTLLQAIQMASSQTKQPYLTFDDFRALTGDEMDSVQIL
jgi:hypothetical protein